ncbi:MAG: protein adenylyltransferase SelO family protein [Candidatus Manganitrophus sp.]|nr:MAG: protein adenylyltransferase SelO family protein [Candidatus Manganitrophus sp.]
MRTRHGGKLFYFNFDLAEEIGLIPKGARRVITPALSQAILDTFSLQIINEYDITHHVKIPKEDIRPHRYMATRYLQMQHPDKKGHTSGDGRSIWNGTFKGPQGRWDISSCGAGVTCLSPATAIEKRYFKTGDKNASYGSGRLDLSDGVGAALMSDIFHRNQIRTERTLAVIAFDDNTCITVRAGKNLLRPAHFFKYLKQGDYSGLKRVVDYHIARQVENKEWPLIRNAGKKYGDLLERITVAFAKAAAQFESEYIFCWMEWDGDNILTDAGIIDYGSVRQFGLFHHEYRYDDVDRLSTSITEQKNKAKYLVQTFAQLTDFLISGKKKNLRAFKNHPSLKRFERIFEQTRDEAVLYRIGFDQNTQALLLKSAQDREQVGKFRTILRYFEKAKAKRGRHAVADGFNWDAIFCVRDILRELPALYSSGAGTLSPKQFINILRSDYASPADVRLSRSRREKIAQFQRDYWILVRRAADLEGRTTEEVLRQIGDRSALINRYNRVTGDAIIFVGQRMVREWKTISTEELHQMFQEFVEGQVLRPESPSAAAAPGRHAKSRKTRRLLHAMLDTVNKYRESV